MKNKIFSFDQFRNKMNESAPFNEKSDLINMIDYTLLTPSATNEDIINLCEKADKLGVKSVCVLPKMVKVAAEALAESNVLVCTVVSFPHGTDTPEQKLAETKRVISDGADEVDMVLNYPKLKMLFKDVNNLENYDTIDIIYNLIFDDVAPLVDECHQHTNKDGEPITLKVIVESGLLTNEETEEATYICLNAGADFIKTSTGMVSVGAELEKVKIMKDIINEEGSDMKIKASGGIRTMEDLKKFETYVDRFGVGFSSVDSIFGSSNDVESDY